MSLATNQRIGLGEDRHRLAKGGPITLGGVEIPHSHHLVGHSDADVLLHAITDAVLGAVGLPDIGELFPNTEEENKGRCSADMLKLAMIEVQQQGWQIVNLDCVVHAETPKLSPHKNSIRESIASILCVHTEQIGLKAKTGEGCGPVGRGEVMDARCVVLLVSI